MHIISTKHTPEIILDIEKRKFIISGSSRPEDAGVFYMPVLEWISDNESKLSQLEDFQFKINLEYYNSSTAKQLISIFFSLEKILYEKATVIWHSDPDDEEMEEAGKEFEDISNLKFVFKKNKI